MVRWRCDGHSRERTVVVAGVISVGAGIAVVGRAAVVVVHRGV